jgi:hypothetical protein
MNPLPHSALLLLAATLPPQAPAPSPAGQERPTKLDEWPALNDDQKQRVLALVGQFKKDDPALREGARDQLAAFGEGIAPLLFLQVSDRNDNVNADIFAVLDRVLTSRHAALMARECKKPKLELRRYVVQRLCRFVDPAMQPVLAAATRDKDAEVAYHAHLGLLGLGEASSLPPVLERSRKEWRAVQPLCAEVLPKARSDALGRAVAEAIAKAQPPVQAAGLRLMRYLATKSQTIIVRTYLQAEDHNVKKEAVNAMRVLNDQAPIEDLSVFQAIEMAKEWLNK